MSGNKKNITNRRKLNILRKLLLEIENRLIPKESNLDKFKFSLLQDDKYKYQSTSDECYYTLNKILITLNDIQEFKSLHDKIEQISRQTITKYRGEQIYTQPISDHQILIQSTYPITAQIELIEESIIDSEEIDFVNNLDFLERVLNNFILFINYNNNLNRYDKRDYNNFKLNDEYDVQDVLKSIFKMIFISTISEINLENKSQTKKVRADFLINDFKIIVEVKYLKKTKNVLKKLQSELLEDINYYFNDKRDLFRLYFFVYDSESSLIDPNQLINFLENHIHSAGKVRVIVLNK
jgi:hypothetical protein